MFEVCFQCSLFFMQCDAQDWEHVCVAQMHGPLECFVISFPWQTATDQIRWVVVFLWQFNAGSWISRCSLSCVCSFLRCITLYIVYRWLCVDSGALNLMFGFAIAATMPPTTQSRSSRLLAIAGHTVSSALSSSLLGSANLLLFIARSCFCAEQIFLLCA